MGEKYEEIRMQRNVGPMAATMIIVSAIVGSGIYVSPTGIVENTETAGFSMVLWLLAGVVAAMGALCYAEVGLLIPKSGGEYPIIYDSYGDVCGFIFAWTCTTIIRPTSFAIFCVTFAKYTFSVVDDGTCSDRSVAEKLLAVAAIWIVVFINCYSTKTSQFLTKVFGYIKICSLFLIILIGVYAVIVGRANLSVWSTTNSFSKEGVTHIPSVDRIGLGLYNGLWSYDGWNQLNYVVEEIKSPEKNLVRAIGGSLGIIALFYLTVNFFYLSILGVNDILTSSAVATDYANAVLPQVSFAIPIMVACSCLGAALVQCMTAARIPYVAARQRQLPHILAMIHMNFLTPAPALILNGLIATIMVIPNDVSSLIDYFSFCMWIFHTATCVAVIVLRRSMPIALYKREFTVPLVIPVLMSIIGTYLVLVPFLQELDKIGKPNERFSFGYLYVFVWIGFGVGLYLALKRASSVWFQKMVTRWTKNVQLLLQVVPEQ